MSSSSYYLIDKSNWVPIWITHTAQVAIFLRPRLFGKSIALSYAHAYLDHSRKSTGHTLHTQMFHAVDLRRDHFHKHSIVALRFGHKSIMATSTPLELELAVMQYLGSVISIIMKSYRKTAKDLIDDFQSYYQLLCGKYPSTNLEEWVDSLSLMIDMLQHFSKVTVAVLVDDYDKVLKKASELQVHDRIANFFSNFYRNGLNKAIKHKKLFKAAIFGTQRFHDKIPFKDVDSHRFFSLGDEPFSREFGFTLIEVAKAIRAFSSDLQVEDLNAVYGGYPTANQAEPLLHPYGIAKALSNGNISQDYWTRRVYIEFDSPPFSNLVGMGVGDLYRLLGTPGDKNISGYTPCHMNLSSLSQSSSCNEVLTYLRHAGLITFQHGNSELRAINRPAVNFLAKNLQNWFSRLTGINNSWLVLASKNWASFEAHLSRAWKTPTVFGNRAPFTLEKRSAFRELFERSANNYGDFLLPLSIEIEDVKIAGKVFRFKSSDQSVVILLVFGFVYDSLKEGQVPSRIAASLIQGLKPKLMNTIPAPNHLMAVIFYAGRPDLGIYIDVV